MRLRSGLGGLLLAAMALGVQAQLIRDDLGREVEAVGAGRRVATLSPFLTEAVAAIGGLAELVAVSDFSDYPPDVRGLPTVASSAGISWEKLAAVRPAIVLAWKDSLREGDLERFQRSRLRVFVFSGRRLDDVPRTMRTLARLLGRDRPPAAIAFEDRLRALRAAHAGKPAVPVLVEISHRPLMTIGADHFIGDALAACGARNAFADLPGIAPEVSWEVVLARDPAAIVGAGAPEGEPDFRSRWGGHRTLAAVRAGALIYLDGDHLFRPGPRLIEGVTTLCLALDRVRNSGTDPDLSAKTRK
jgi:iron complex transport system substrate-binding protein